MDFVVVVSRYNENIDWCRFINSNNLVIYDKSNSPLPGSIPRKNIGRESDTFVQYILDNYHNLPEYIIFLQGNPFDHFLDKNITPENLETNIRTLVSSSTDTAPLFTNVHLEPVGAYKGLNVSEYYELLFNKPSPNIMQFSAGCQYIVPRYRILHRPMSFYEMLSSMLAESTFTHDDLHDDTHDTIKFDKNVINPWTFERMALTIFSNID
jgi:hypothetical protein